MKTMPIHDDAFEQAADLADRMTAKWKSDGYNITVGVTDVIALAVLEYAAVRKADYPAVEKNEQIYVGLSFDGVAVGRGGASSSVEAMAKFAAIDAGVAKVVTLEEYKETHQRRSDWRFPHMMHDAIWDGRV